ncbi:aspartate dehydrogenase [Desertibacillus haloalkaliphilus]|uniref:aspartate dehydrogenase n=1 Tax=Desertibacillus haloalkaliphilus TaxID=1328930 RepID=UPI001C27BF36|nr:aspartate dehydrogenase [Desertibacillus haloalkaliphilus]MBU8908232.1 aspartate dehydrogenase [Desertibacillus haloalkaliphilus]
MLKIGMIGFGTIGQQLLDLIEDKKLVNTKVESILVRNIEKVHNQLGNNRINVTDDPEYFFSQDLDFIVEAAGHEAVRQYGKTALVHGSNLILVSVGSLADDSFLNEIKEAAEKVQKQIIIPSAAIGGLDRVASGSIGDIDQVKQITRKQPKAWYGTKVEKEFDLESIKEPTCIFKGKARESAEIFPENVNVSAALSLAGIGFDRTEVEVYIDPSIDRNTHEVFISGHFGQTKIEIQNTPSPDNPKTGYIVAMSIAKVLNSYTNPVVLGV